MEIYCKRSVIKSGLGTLVFYKSVTETSFNIPGLNALAVEKIFYYITTLHHLEVHYMSSFDPLILPFEQ